MCCKQCKRESTIRRAVHDGWQVGDVPLVLAMTTRLLVGRRVYKFWTCHNCTGYREAANAATTARARFPQAPLKDGMTPRGVLSAFFGVLWHVGCARCTREVRERAKSKEEASGVLLSLEWKLSEIHCDSGGGYLWVCPICAKGQED